MSFPRPLTALEKDIIHLLLSAEFPGSAELDRQVEDAVASRPMVEGLPSIYIDVETSFQAENADNRKSPITAVVANENEELVGFILLAFADGLLSYLEFAWVTDEAPTEFPPADRIFLDSDPRSVKVSRKLPSTHIPRERSSKVSDLDPTQGRRSTQ